MGRARPRGRDRQVAAAVYRLKVGTVGTTALSAHGGNPQERAGSQEGTAGAIV